MTDIEQLQKDLQETIRALEKLPLGTLPWWLLVHPFGFRERISQATTGHNCPKTTTLPVPMRHKMPVYQLADFHPLYFGDQYR